MSINTLAHASVVPDRTQPTHATITPLSKHQKIACNRICVTRTNGVVLNSGEQAGIGPVGLFYSYASASSAPHFSVIHSRQLAMFYLTLHSGAPFLRRLQRIRAHAGERNRERVITPSHCSHLPSLFCVTFLRLIPAAFIRKRPAIKRCRHRRFCSMMSIRWGVRNTKQRRKHF